MNPKFRACLLVTCLEQIACLQVLAAASEQPDEDPIEDDNSDDQPGATSDEEDDEGDLDDIDLDEASSSSDEEEEDQETAAGVPQAKKQKLAGQGQGLGSVGWDASDEEDEPSVPAAETGRFTCAGFVMHPCMNSPALTVGALAVLLTDHLECILWVDKKLTIPVSPVKQGWLQSSCEP